MSLQTATAEQPCFQGVPVPTLLTKRSRFDVLAVETVSVRGQLFYKWIASNQAQPLSLKTSSKFRNIDHLVSILKSRDLLLNYSILRLGACTSLQINHVKARLSVIDFLT